MEVSRDTEDIIRELGLELSRGAASEDPELDTVTSASSSEKQSMAGSSDWCEEERCGGGVLGGTVFCSWCSSCRTGCSTEDTSATRKLSTGTSNSAHLTSSARAFASCSCRERLPTARRTLGSSSSCLTPGLRSGSRDIISWMTLLSSGARCAVRLGSGPRHRRSCHSCPDLGRSRSVASSSSDTPRLNTSHALVNLAAMVSGAR